MKKDFIVPLIVVGFLIAAFVFLRPSAQDLEKSPIDTRDEVTTVEDVPSQQAAKEAESKLGEIGQTDANGLYNSGIFTLQLPSTHQIIRNGQLWYIKENVPENTPDMTVERLNGTAEEIIAARFADAPGVSIATTEDLKIPGGYGKYIKVVFPGYEVGSTKGVYLITHEKETYILTEWEDLAWNGFDNVARSFTFVE